MGFVGCMAYWLLLAWLVGFDFALFGSSAGSLASWLIGFLTDWLLAYRLLGLPLGLP